MLPWCAVTVTVSSAVNLRRESIKFSSPVHEQLSGGCNGAADVGEEMDCMTTFP